MDIGCGFPLNLILCYYNFDTNLLVGIDQKWNKLAILNYWVGQNKKGKDLIKARKCDTLFSLHNLLFEGGKDNLDEIAFKNKIESNLKLNQKIELYDFSETEKYDLIIANNSLHFIKEESDLREVIKNIIKTLKPDGRLFLRIENQKRNWGFEEFKSIIKEYFDDENLFSYGKIEGYEYSHCYFKNF